MPASASVSLLSDQMVDMKFITTFNAVNVDTGSFKYNASADSRNAENALIDDALELVKAYWAKFTRLWSESKVIQ